MGDDINELQSLQDHLAFFIPLACVKRPDILPPNVVVANRTKDVLYMMASRSHLSLLHPVSKDNVDDTFKQIRRAISAMKSLYISLDIVLMHIIANVVTMRFGKTVPKRDMACPCNVPLRSNPRVMPDEQCSYFLERNSVVYCFCSSVCKHTLDQKLSGQVVQGRELPCY